MSGEFIPEPQSYPDDAPKGFCFGAFTLPLFWGIARRSWIGVAVFVVGYIPPIGAIAKLAGSIYMGINGHRDGLGGAP
ncbi:hypothetical protein IIA16_05025 [bacterium]|nr:hypothetical protein [bacterium]